MSQDIKKALQDLAEALDNDTVERVKVMITLVKPKSSKTDKPESE